MASAGLQYQAKPRLSQTWLDLVRVKSNQAKHKAGLVRSGLPEFCLDSNNSAYNGYNSASLSMPWPSRAWDITSGYFHPTSFSLLLSSCSFCKYHARSVSSASKRSEFIHARSGFNVNLALLNDRSQSDIEIGSVWSTTNWTRYGCFLSIVFQSDSLKPSIVSSAQYCANALAWEWGFTDVHEIRLWPS